MLRTGSLISEAALSMSKSDITVAVNSSRGLLPLTFAMAMRAVHMQGGFQLFMNFVQVSRKDKQTIW